ncbi:DUF1217 domain-containing protein [Pontibaca methylaminivorans]|uniref:DUF1217 domain-containing protein n=1 Tax=Pontibaca methylaminivorans TaxID=515897 RepID=UPI002FDA1A55
MTYQPVIAGTGIAGWKFLQRTYDAQFLAFKKSSAVVRDLDYFKEEIGNITTAADLVGNRRLLSVALSAFGLENDLNNRYFIQKVLEDGTKVEDSLANRLMDGRYKKLSAAFGFGAGEAVRTSDPEAMAEIISLYRMERFESAIGNVDDVMRIVLFAERELAGISAAPISENAKWFTVMGSPPLREMFETALRLPAAFGKLDIDRQLDIFKDKMAAFMGDSSISQFAEPGARERLTTRFLALSQVKSASMATSPAANSLILLRGY